MATTADFFEQALARKSGGTGLLDTAARSGVSVGDTSLSATQISDAARTAALVGKTLGLAAQSPGLVQAAGTLGLVGSAVADPVGTAVGVGLQRAGAAAPVVGGVMGGLSAARTGGSVAAGVMGGAANSLASAAMYAVNPFLGIANTALGWTSGFIGDKVADYNMGAWANPDLGFMDTMRLGDAVHENDKAMDTLGIGSAALESSLGGVTTASDKAGVMQSVSTDKAIADYDAGWLSEGSGWNGGSDSATDGPSNDDGHQSSGD